MHYTTTLQQNPYDPFFSEWPVFVEHMGSMFGLINQRAQAQRKIHHMRMREEDCFTNYITVRATLRGGLRHLTEWKSKENSSEEFPHCQMVDILTKTQPELNIELG
jgi:hypothetical protein